MSQTQPVQVAALPFQEGVTVAMGRIQASLNDLIAQLPGIIRRAVDLERALRVEKKLAWQLFRLSRAADTAEVANVPSLASIGRVVEAARKRGVPEEVLVRVRRAFEEFETFAEDHCGDRMGLLSMVSSMGDQKDDQLDLRIRKARHKTDAHIWGVQARMQVSTTAYFIRPGPEQVCDVATIRGDMDLGRLRQNDPLVVLRWMATRGDPAPNQPILHRDGSPVHEPRVSAHGVELLPQFCSQPLPRMEPMPGRDGQQSTETELVISPGRSGAVTLYSAQLKEHITEGPQTCYAMGQFVTVPMEEKVCELLVPAGLSDPTTARVVIYGRRTHPEQVYDLRPSDRLPQRETAMHMGTMDSAPPLTGDPHHEPAVRHVLGRLGWTERRFDVYRCRVQYPVLHTLIYLCVDPLRR